MNALAEPARGRRLRDIAEAVGRAWRVIGMRRERLAAIPHLGRFSADPLQDIGLSRSDLPAWTAGLIAADPSRRQR